MSFVEAISSCFRNYANFTGRAVRSEFWYWYIFVVIVLIVFGAINGSLYPGPLAMGPFSYVTMAIVLALILPSLAVSVRRLHDIDLHRLVGLDRGYSHRHACPDLLGMRARHIGS